MASRKDKIIMRTAKTTTTTNIEQIFNREYDFNNHKEIFDFKHEYQNNYKIAAQLYNLKNMDFKLDHKQNNSSDPIYRFPLKQINKPGGQQRQQLVNVPIQDNHLNECSPIDINYLFCDEVQLTSSVEQETSVHESYDSPKDPYTASDDDRDKDYIVSEKDLNCTLSDASLVIESNKQKNVTVTYPSKSSPYQHCEFDQCKLKVFSSCDKCFCLLCSEHFTNQLELTSCEKHCPYSTEISAFYDLSIDVEDKENNINYLNLLDIEPLSPSNQLNNKTISSDIITHELNKNNQTKQIYYPAKKNTTNKENTNIDVSHCEYTQCNDEVFSTCSKCLCYLCYSHFIAEDTYNECQNHSSSFLYTENSKSNKVQYEKLNKNKIQETCPRSNTQSEVNQVDKGLTKKGEERKRRKIDEPIHERREKKLKVEKDKLNLKDPCPFTCRKKCTQKISEARRIEINNEYVALSWEMKGCFIKSLVVMKKVACRKTSPKKQFKRNISYFYYFYEDKTKIEVCKTFFLTTLGYNPKNDKRLMLALQRPIDKQNYQKGKYERKPKYDKDLIRKHIIDTYNPLNSHYRREHAPLRLYLPSDISITLMHKHFCDVFPDQIVSFEVFRKIVRDDLNISFANLGNEECEVCTQYKFHKKQELHNSDDCDFCTHFTIHKSRYRQSRKAYKNDVKEAENRAGSFYSVDLQKVVMIPRMEQFKSAIFCPRVIAFNESFVPLGKSTKDNMPFAAVWNESITGRKQEDIISTFNAFLLHRRDVEHLVLWVDNCSAQNKNWAILSYLVYIINSNQISAKTITVKYFEPGHTFMSADSFHHQVEQALKKKNKVYDFSDFVDAVQQANSRKTYVKVMEANNFYNFSDLSSQHKMRKMQPRVYLKDIMVLIANRGEFTLQYKINHDDKETQCLDFLQLKYLKTRTFPEFSLKETPRGIPKSTKNEIIKKLVELMPDNRKEFWLNLPVSIETSDID